MRKTITDDELTGKVRQMKYMTTDPAGAQKANRQLIYEATYADEAALTANKPNSIKASTYNQQHHLITYIHDRINEQGDIWRTIFQYRYQYDEHRNWIEKTETMNNKNTGFQDKVQFIRKREITYYP